MMVHYMIFMKSFRGASHHIVWNMLLLLGRISVCVSLLVRASVNYVDGGDDEFEKL